MDVRIDIKKLLTQEDVTLTKVAEEMSKYKGKKFSQSNLSQKLLRGTLKYEEAKLIGKILGYDLRFVKVKYE